MPGGLIHEATVGATVEWYTPSWIFDTLGIRFDLDPASPMQGPVPWIPADRFYTERDDGLVQPWEGEVWLNPPYGRLTGPFLARMHAHRQGVALVFSRTDNSWFHEYIAHADMILFLQGRIKFIDGSGKIGPSPGAGSLLAAWGSRSVAALRSAPIKGTLWEPRFMVPDCLKGV